MFSRRWTFINTLFSASPLVFGTSEWCEEVANGCLFAQLVDQADAAFDQVAQMSARARF